jgi:hypothetical protein
MSYNISIFRQLKGIYGQLTRTCGRQISEFGLGIAYLRALFGKGRNPPKSKNPLVDEGVDVYQGLKRINGHTLGLNHKAYLKNLEQLYSERLGNGSYTAREGTVEELVVKNLKDDDKDLDMHDIAARLGKLLKNFVVHKPHYGILIKNIGVGNIQRIEQKIIRRDLEKLLN